MDKWEKAGIAKLNSEKLKSAHAEYTAVDGRTYTPDRRVPSGKACIKTAAIRNRRDRPSMIDVYRIEHWLSGKGRYTGSAVPAGEKQRIIAEYGLEFSNRLRQYSAPEESIWELMLRRFSQRIAEEQIGCYAELQYRAKRRR